MKYLYNLNSLSFKVKFSIVSAIFLVFGIFGAVMVSQQQQEIRSRAADGVCWGVGEDCDDTPSSPIIAGTTWYSDGTTSKSVTPGASITARASNVPSSVNGYQLVSGTSGGNINAPCSQNTTILNSAQVFSGSTGIIGNVGATVNLAVGDWHVCFKEVAPGVNTTTPLVLTVTSSGAPSSTPTPIPVVLPTPIPTTISDTIGTGNCATVNVSSGEDLIADDCTINSGFNGSIRGSRNIIKGGLGGAIGNIFGDNNLIQGGMNGTITGNGNEICGDLGGSINGNNNIIHGTLFRGGTDNGTGNLILPGTPCGYRPSPSPSPTSTPTPAPTRTPTPTPIPTSIPTATPTVTIGDTIFSFDLLLHGIGKGGDSVNPIGGNPNPLHPQRQITIEVLNTQNQIVLTKAGAVNFNSTNGNFTGSVNMGKVLSTGAYTIKIKSTQYLRRIVPGIQSITAGIANQLPQAVLVTGDITGPNGVADNALNILDYNIIIGCYSDFLPAASCTTENKLLADLGDDGKVNQFDYNLFLRELTNVTGQ